MFGFRKRRAEKVQRQIDAYEAGKRGGEAILHAVDEYIQFRLSEIATSYLVVFGDRLKTIADEKDHEPKEVAKVELKIFIEQLLNLPEKLRAEYRERLPKWYALAKEVGFSDSVDEYIYKLVNEKIEQIYTDAALMADKELVDLTNSKDENLSP